jgi:hypothetical protein
MGSGSLVKFYPARTKHWEEEQFWRRILPYITLKAGDNNLTKKEIFVILAEFGILLFPREDTKR